jgi:hypothetical protein
MRELKQLLMNVFRRRTWRQPAAATARPLRPRHSVPPPPNPSPGGSNRPSRARGAAAGARTEEGSGEAPGQGRFEAGAEDGGL